MGIFSRMSTDRRIQEVALEDVFAASVGSACFVLGGGPALRELDFAELERTPVGRMSINLAGTGLVRPHFWTAYDPTQRFSRSTYLDPAVMKFVHRRRAFDLVPETTWKVCECPNLYLFEGDRQRGFSDFLDPRHTAIVDWNDSLVQAIDILYRLGFRTLYLAGCPLRVEPSLALRELAVGRGIAVPEEAGLTEFARCCERGGVRRQELEQLEPVELYHFDERKSLRAALVTDAHYYRIVEYLRLSRGAMARAGLRLVSVTPGSRLNAYFPYLDPREAMRESRFACGDPAGERTLGRYSGVQERLPSSAAGMRDFSPPHWPAQTGNVSPLKENGAAGKVQPPARGESALRAGLLAEIERSRAADVLVEEIG
ncbi:MAG: hypothetical protein R3C12_00485 [Planctomycetaceae bacterium]